MGKGGLHGRRTAELSTNASPFKLSTPLALMAPPNSEAPSRTKESLAEFSTPPLKSIAPPFNWRGRVKPARWRGH